MKTQQLIHDSTKYDGSLHYRYPVEVISQSENHLAVYRGPEVRLESYRGVFNSGFQALSIYFANAYYNVTVAWQPDWEPRMHYVNIATPASWNAERIQWTDMDLDLIIRAENGEIIIDDEDEFDEHIVKFTYPKPLIDTCRNELEKIHAAMVRRDGIFDREIFDWRPGALLRPEFLAAM